MNSIIVIPSGGLNPSARAPIRSFTGALESGVIEELGPGLQQESHLPSSTLLWQAKNSEQDKALLGTSDAQNTGQTSAKDAPAADQVVPPGVRASPPVLQFGRPPRPPARALHYEALRPSQRSETVYNMNGRIFVNTGIVDEFGDEITSPTPDLDESLLGSDSESDESTCSCARGCSCTGKPVLIRNYSWSKTRTDLNKEQHAANGNGKKKSRGFLGTSKKKWKSIGKSIGRGVGKLGRGTTFAPLTQAFENITQGKPSRKVFREFIGDMINYGPDYEANAVIVRVDPMVPPVLRQEAVINTGYTPRKWNVDFTPSVAATKAGKFGDAVIADPNQSIPDTAAAWQGSTLFHSNNEWESVATPTPGKILGREKTYLVGTSNEPDTTTDLRLEEPGAHVISLIDTDEPANGSEVVGQVYVDYDVEFTGPRANPDAKFTSGYARYDMKAGYTSATIFDDMTASSFNTINLAFDGVTMRFPAGSVGTYMVTLVLHSTNQSNTCTTITNATDPSYWLDASPYITQSTANNVYGIHGSVAPALATAGVMTLVNFFDVTKLAADEKTRTLTMGTGVTNFVVAMTTKSGGTLIVNRVNSQLDFVARHQPMIHAFTWDFDIGRYVRYRDFGKPRFVRPSGVPYKPYRGPMEMNMDAKMSRIEYDRRKEEKERKRDTKREPAYCDECGDPVGQCRCESTPIIRVEIPSPTQSERSVKSRNDYLSGKARNREAHSVTGNPRRGRRPRRERSHSPEEKHRLRAHATSAEPADSVRGGQGETSGNTQSQSQCSTDSRDAGSDGGRPTSSVKRRGWEEDAKRRRPYLSHECDEYVVALLFSEMDRALATVAAHVIPDGDGYDETLGFEGDGPPKRGSRGGKRVNPQRKAPKSSPKQVWRAKKAEKSWSRPIVSSFSSSSSEHQPPRTESPTPVLGVDEMKYESKGGESKEACRHFAATGECKYADACRFSHIVKQPVVTVVAQPPEAANVPPPLPFFQPGRKTGWYAASERPTCLFGCPGSKCKCDCLVRAPGPVTFAAQTDWKTAWHLSHEELSELEVITGYRIVNGDQPNGLSFPLVLAEIYQLTFLAPQQAYLGMLPDYTHPPVGMPIPAHIQRHPYEPLPLPAGPLLVYHHFDSTAHELGCSRGKVKVVRSTRTRNADVRTLSCPSNGASNGFGVTPVNQLPPGGYKCAGVVGGVFYIMVPDPLGQLLPPYYRVDGAIAEASNARRMEIVRELQAAACSAFSRRTKDFDSPTDTAICEGRVLDMAKRNKLYELCDDVDEVNRLVSRCTADGIHEAFQARLRRVQRLRPAAEGEGYVAGELVDNEESTRFSRTERLNWLQTGLRHARPRTWETLTRGHSLAEKLKFWESDKVASRGMQPRDSWAVQPWDSLLYYVIGMFVRCIVWPLCEEAFKHSGTNFMLYIMLNGFSALGLFVIGPAIDRARECYIDDDTAAPPQDNHVSACTHAFYLVMAAWLLPALIISVWEARKKPIQILYRWPLHAVLLWNNFWQAFVLHAAWNALWEHTNLVGELQLNTLYEYFITQVGGPGRHADVCMQDHPIVEPKRNPHSHLSENTEQACESKFGTWIAHWFGHPVYVLRSCAHNELVGLKGRVLKWLPVHEEDEREAVKQHWAAATARHLPRLIAMIGKIYHPVPFREWIKRFEPGKRALLQRLRDSVDTMSGVVNIASSFVKRQKTIAFPDKDPRIIQGCDPRVNCDTGNWLVKLAKIFRKRCRPTSWSLADLLQGRQVIYCSGMTASQIGSDCRHADRLLHSLCPPGDRVCYIEDDQSRFDMHMLDGPCAFMDALYRAVLPAFVAHILRRGINVGRTLWGHFYWVLLTMLSGMTDTAIFDTIVNWLMKNDIHVPGRIWISFIIGDDSITFTLESELNRLGGTEGLKIRYSRFGMDVTVDVRLNMLDITFCSGRLYPTVSSYVLMPKIGNYLVRSVAAMKDYGPVGRLEWLRGAAATLENFGLVDPCCAALARSVRRWCGYGKVRYDESAQALEYKYRPSKTAATTVEAVARYYDHHYGFSLADVHTLCRQLESLSYEGSSILPLLDAMVERDSG